MANAWVFHGSSMSVGTQEGGLARLNDGQYIVATLEDFGNNYTRFRGRTKNNNGKWGTVAWSWALSTNKSTTQISLGNGRYLRRLTKANSLRYGSANHHAKSGGNLYTIRKTTQMVHADGRHYTTLNPGDRVVIQPGGGFFDPTRKRIRAWGYRRKGSATDYETTGLYVNESPLHAATSYKLNTI